MGRTPFCDGLFESPEDLGAVERAMRITDTTQFRDARLPLAQRRASASAWCSHPRLPRRPRCCCSMSRRLSSIPSTRWLCSASCADLAHEGLLVVTVTHDLNLAAAYSQELLLLRAGRTARRRAARAGARRRDAARRLLHRRRDSHLSDSGRRWIVYGD